MIWCKVICGWSAILLLFAPGVLIADDIVKLRDGTKILGHVDWYHKGKITVFLEDGTERTFRISTVDNIVFGAAANLKLNPEPEVAPRPKSIPKPKYKEFRNPVPPKESRLPGLLKLEYLSYGSGTIDRNSLPFQIYGKRLLVFLGFVPHGTSPFASIDISAVEDDRFINASLSESDFGNDEDQTLFGFRIEYGAGKGDAYAEVSTQNCDWLFAVVSVDEIPSKNEVEEAGRTILKRSGWPPIPLQK